MTEHISRADAVRRITPKGEVQGIAVGMVACGPHAADYILQSPVLALAAAWSSPANAHAARNHALRLFAQRIEKRPKLRDLMAQYNVAYQFRALRKAALAKSHFRVIIAIGQANDLHPSALAQAIPAKPADQARWLRCIEAFASKIENRSRRLRYRDVIAWPTIAFSRPAVDGAISPHAASDLADFFLSDPSQWNPKWTFDQARQNEARWHTALAENRRVAAIHSQIGTGFADKISYAPLPLNAEACGFHFVALDSGEALFEEGRAMHHCVSTYTAEVVSGRARIYSIRNADMRIATLEIGAGARENYWRIHQVRGPYNSLSSHAVLGAVSVFMTQINKRPIDGCTAEGLAA